MIQSVGTKQPRSLLGNALMLFSARVVIVMLSLISTPIVLHRLGLPGYGVYVLALTFSGLLALLDLGLTPAVVSFLSHAHHEGDEHASQRIVSTAFTVYLLIGILGGLALLALVPWLVSGLLHVPAGLRGPATFALGLSTLGFALNMWLGVFYAVPFALERYDLIAGRTIVLGLLTTSATILYALHGGGIEGLMLINVGGATVSIAVFALVSRSLLPQVRWRPAFHASTFRTLAGFSSVKFAGTIGGVLAFRFDQFAIGSLLGVNAVGLYAIPANLSLRIQGLFLDLASPIFPRAAKLRADAGGARRLFLSSSRALVLVSAGVLITAFVYADLILTYWIGGAEGRIVAAQGTAALRWLLAAFFIQSVAVVPAIFCEGMGKPGINNSFAVASAIIHVPLVLLLVPRLGITGAAVALFINGAVQTVVFIGVASWRIAKVTPDEILRRAVFRPLVAAGAAAAVAYSIRPLVSNLATLGATLLLSLVAYVVAALLVGALRREDLAAFRRFTDRLTAWLRGRRVLPQTQMEADR